MNDTPVVVTISCPDRAVADRLGRELVTRRLVACAQLFPIHSIYRWKESLQAEDEYLLQAKTTEGRLEELEHYVLHAHPYEVPEIIALPVQGGHGPYLDWIKGQTQ